MHPCEKHVRAAWLVDEYRSQLRGCFHLVRIAHVAVQNRIFSTTELLNSAWRPLVCWSFASFPISSAVHVYTDVNEYEWMKYVFETTEQIEYIKKKFSFVTMGALRMMMISKPIQHTNLTRAVLIISSKHSY